MPSPGPPAYDASQSQQFGGALPDPPTYDQAAAKALPVPLDRTTTYVPGTQNGPRELLAASSQVELWDDEIGVDVHDVGIFTLPEMDLMAGSMEDVMVLLRRVADEILAANKFLVAIGGEHSMTSALVAAAAAPAIDAA